MKSRRKAFIIFILVLVIPIAFYFVLKRGTYEYVTLPIYGERNVKEITKADGTTGVDTVYHTIPAFSFTDQSGNITTEKNFDQKIYVANFFFASCPEICPRMNEGMEKVAKKFEDNPDIKFISHTVNPEKDSVPVLRDYAARFHAKQNTWYFVTGNKKSLYEIANKGYLVTAAEGDVKPESFIHSEKLVLIDKEKRIRGMYDGLDPKEVEPPD